MAHLNLITVFSISEDPVVVKSTMCMLFI